MTEVLNMVTQFGKHLRKMRIERSETLRDMANTLNVSGSYLSAIERGVKNVPTNLCDAIVRKYSLNSHEAKMLDYAREESATTIKLSLINCSQILKNVAIEFARCFNNMSDSTAQKILYILKEEQRKRMDNT